MLAGAGIPGRHGVHREEFITLTILITITIILHTIIIIYIMITIIIMIIVPGRQKVGRQREPFRNLAPEDLGARGPSTPDLPTKITPTKIAGLKLSGKFPMGLGIPPLELPILLESNPLKSRILVRRLAVRRTGRDMSGGVGRPRRRPDAPSL